MRDRSKNLKLLLAFLLLPAIIAPAFETRLIAQSTAVSESADIELYQALLDLQNPWTVMCVAAHPDDEDGSTLTVLRRKSGAHTVTLFSTYGEGGQNAIGAELYEELGAIRARETEEASEIQGSEPHFLALPDFGFSKSAEETFRVWNKSEALRRMVLKIRQLRPDVIITNHSQTGGHGHHQATGRLILEAFDAAADPQFFPEQLRGGVSVWQAQRLFVRIFGNDANTNQPNAQIITINPNERDPLRNKTYAEQALLALHRHASQGPWPKTVPPSGANPIRYRLVREAKQAAPLPEGAQTFVEGLLPSEAVRQWLDQLKLHNLPLTSFINDRQRLFYILGSFRIARPGSLYHHDTQHMVLMKRIDRALAALSGIKLTVTPRKRTVTPNSSVTLGITISNQGEMTALLPDAGSPVRRIGAVPLQLPPKTSITLKQLHSIPDNAPVNIPHSAHLYDGALAGKEFEVAYEVEINSIRFPVTARTRVDVAPRVEIKSITPSPLVLTPPTIKRPHIFTLRLINHRDSTLEGEIITSVVEAERAASNGKRTPGSNTSTSLKRFNLRANETKDVQLDSAGLSAWLNNTSEKKHSFPNQLLMTIREKSSRKTLTKQSVSVAYSDARVIQGLRVGYIRSFDDTLRDALDSLGVESKELSVDEIKRGNLGGYDTIIIDNRGYYAHPELIAANARLLDYVREGGNLMVFYHKTNEWNEDAQKARPQLAPYPITLGNSRVTEENAPVEFVESAHALLNVPNKITQEDFKDWIQERGLYFPQKWDAHYSAPLATNDEGEAPLRGGLLVSDYGRGRYIYTSLVWYRQLRAGVPGAYRMFANMISYARKEQKK